jgi:hypothetical protein
MKTNKLQKGLARTCLTATAFSALLTLTTYIGAATQGYFILKSCLSMSRPNEHNCWA